MDIADPVNSHFFLSDVVQDEISREKNMKCRPCGHGFTREFYGSCSKCFSLDPEETADETDEFKLAIP